MTNELITSKCLRMQTAELITNTIEPPYRELRFRDVYCEVEFIKKVYDACQTTLFNKLQEHILWCNVYNFILSARLIVNKNVQEISNGILNNDDIIADIQRVKQEANGQFIKWMSFNNVEYLLEENSLSNSMLNAVYLTSLPSETCVMLRKLYGVQIICIDDISSGYASRFFETGSTSILNDPDLDVEELSNWDFLSQFSHACNAMVLIDNYYFSQDNWSSNLIPLLKCFLPAKSLRIPFHLSFVIGEKQVIEYNLVINDILKQIHNIISKTFGLDYSIRISFHVIKGKIHDRSLITNYMYLSVPYGFNFVFHNNRFRIEDTESHCFFPITSKGMCIYNQKLDKILASSPQISSNLFTSFDLKLRHQKRINQLWSFGRPNRLFE